MSYKEEHICCDSSDISGKVSRVGETPTIDISRVLQMVQAKIEIIGNSLLANITDCGERLRARCSVICSLSDVYYLNVSPDEIQWITDDVGVVFEVESNVEWIIVNS